MQREIQMAITSNNSSIRRYARDELCQPAVFQVESSEECQSMKKDQYEEMNQGKKMYLVQSTKPKNIGVVKGKVH